MGEGLPSSFPKAAGMIVPLKSGENQHLHVYSPPHYRLSKNDEICHHKFHFVPPFFHVPPVCPEPQLQVADAAEPMK